ncbi:MAG: HAMP domain-containing histidine kinase [Ruminococcus sp.]|uniref:sensor histidine kinase n=1 Tax=Ruminococcus sp. TaxID=41978 RepID=UPI0025D51A49|nr:HAMP domain-containing sensor histidine kinase [Ruminococcus sp.]MCR5600711.1 HAMP domain-containing histidine kinase [Ruminococcus sp.]
MDRTDRFINNRAPKRLLLIFIILIALSAGISYYISEVCAEKIVRGQISSELAVAGGGKFTDIPQEEYIANGEELFKKYSIDHELPPKLMKSYSSVRNTVFIPMFGLLALLSVVWFAVALRELMTIYSDLEKLRDECIEAADKANSVINLYGEDLGSVHRISDAAERLVNRINGLRIKLLNEQHFQRTFLTDLSHQIKTSLAVIRLNTDMLSEFDDLSAERRDKLSDEVQLNLDCMERLVIEAIKLAKLNADAIEYRMEPCSLAEVCEIAVKRMSPLLRNKKISVAPDLDRSIRMDCDKGWLCEAVENIIKNSADHADCSELKVKLYEDAVLTTIAISDNGKGIPQEDIPKLFERFSVKSNDKTMYSSGLGMSISQKIVRAHGGEILVYSELGKGTRFEFVFIKS